MQEQPYSNREIDIHFQDIKESLARIEAQTTKTNGRVSALEAWKSASVGYTAGAGACIVIIIGLVTYIFKSEINTINAKETDTQTIIVQHLNNLSK